MNKITPQYFENLFLVFSEGNIPLKHNGICGNLRNKVTLDFPTYKYEGIYTPKSIAQVAESWQHYSGDYFYPVPSPYSDISPKRMFVRTVHKWEGKYGTLRKDLAKYLADHALEFYTAFKAANQHLPDILFAKMKLKIVKIY